MGLCESEGQPDGHILENLKKIQERNRLTTPAVSANTLLSAKTWLAMRPRPAPRAARITNSPPAK